MMIVYDDDGKILNPMKRLGWSCLYILTREYSYTFYSPFSNPSPHIQRRTSNAPPYSQHLNAKHSAHNSNMHNKPRAFPQPLIQHGIGNLPNAEFCTKALEPGFKHIRTP